MPTDFVDVYKLTYTRGYTTTLRITGSDNTYPVANIWYDAGGGQGLRKYTIVGDGKQTNVWEAWRFPFYPADLYAEVYITGNKPGCRNYLIQLTETRPTRFNLHLPTIYRSL
jgi:hypothetical protein